MITETLRTARSHASLRLLRGEQYRATRCFALLHWGGWIAFGAVRFVWTGAVRHKSKPSAVAA
jgi:hypothetical protein